MVLPGKVMLRRDLDFWSRRVWMTDEKTREGVNRSRIPTSKANNSNDQKTGALFPAIEVCVGS